MNEFLMAAARLKEKNPDLVINIKSDAGRKFWVISIARDGKEIFNVMGSDMTLLFNNALSKLQVHRKELT